MGGEIGLADGVEIGACFYLRVPYSQIKQAEDLDIVKLAGNSILLIEDVDYNAWANQAY